MFVNDRLVESWKRRIRATYRTSWIRAPRNAKKKMNAGMVYTTHICCINSSIWSYYTSIIALTADWRNSTFSFFDWSVNGGKHLVFTNNCYNISTKVFISYSFSSFAHPQKERNWECSFINEITRSSNSISSIGIRSRILDNLSRLF